MHKKWMMIVVGLCALLCTQSLSAAEKIEILAFFHPRDHFSEKAFSRVEEFISKNNSYNITIEYVPIAPETGGFGFDGLYCDMYYLGVALEVSPNVRTFIRENVTNPQSFTSFDHLKAFFLAHGVSQTKWDALINNSAEFDALKKRVFRARELTKTYHVIALPFIVADDAVEKVPGFDAIRDRVSTKTNTLNQIAAQAKTPPVSMEQYKKEREQAKQKQQVSSAVEDARIENITKQISGIAQPAPLDVLRMHDYFAYKSSTFEPLRRFYSRKAQEQLSSSYFISLHDRVIKRRQNLFQVNDNTPINMQLNADAATFRFDLCHAEDRGCAPINVVMLIREDGQWKIDSDK